jgi:hypothetical protein
MSSKNQDSKWGSRITKIGFTIIILGLLINIIFGKLYDYFRKS